MAFFHRELAFLVVAEVELGLHVAADRFERARGEHALGRATRPHHAVDAESSFEGGLESSGDVAGGDQLDPGPDVADHRDGLLVAVAVEDDDRQLLHGQPFGLGDPPEVPFHWHLEVDHAPCLATDHQLFHVVDVSREHGSPLGQSHDRDRAGQA